MAAPSGSIPLLAERQSLPLVDGRHPDATDRVPIPCTYCLHEIEASSFAFWSTAGLLLSASCPACRRRTTLRRTTWARLSTRVPGRALRGS